MRQHDCVQAGQGSAPGETGATASRQHLASALLHGLQPGHTGARQHAGIAQRGHDGHQRIKLRLRLTGASRPALLQLRQRQAGDMRETTLRFLAGAWHLPAAAGAKPFTKAFRREAVGQAGEGGGGGGDRL